jgi:RNA polymerase sigma-70 factor (ECF subfamily)
MDNRIPSPEGSPMSEATDFHDLIRRVRAGDEEAATDLVRRYEPAIRRAVRIRLGDTRLERAFDSMDVCQSVMASFFVRAALGQYELDAPEQLLKLLATMARYKLADRVDQERAGCRDNRRVEEGSAETREVAAAQGTPSRQVAARELLEEVQRRMSPEERQLVEMRQQGMDWAAIAKQLGGSPDALRKRLARATDRVARELGLDEHDYE